MHIYLSPHNDDACFSLGSFAVRQGGVVVSIFTRSLYVAVPMPMPSGREDRIATISAIRNREDISFTSAAGLGRYDLALEEPSLIGYKPFDLAEFDAAVTRTSNHLIPFLLGLLPERGDPRSTMLYCPAGIGGHRDHLSTLAAVRGAHDALRQRCTVHLYEDLHYASDPQAREAGLKRVAQVFAGASLSPTFHMMNAREAKRKMALIGLYASQHPQPPGAAKFTPASSLKPALHEITWHVDRGG